jgi:serine protease Do
VPGKLVVLLADTYTSGFVAGQPSVALGSVSNVRRPAGKVEGPERARSVYHYSPLIEFEARPNAGFSGAAVFDLDGEMIGLTSTVAAVAGEGGTGYALPLDANTLRIVETLKRGEEVEYGFLGVILRGEGGPGLTVDVSPRGPAETAGLMDRDRITRIDGRRVDDYADLLLHAGSALAGSRIRVTYSRNGQERNADVVLAKFKGDTPFIAFVRPEPVFGLRVDYGSVLLQTLNVGARTAAEIPAGVTVRELLPDSPAAAKFKALGENGRWLITGANGTPTPTPRDFYKAAAGRPAVKLTVLDLSDANARPRDVTLP